MLLTTISKVHDYVNWEGCPFFLLSLSQLFLSYTERRVTDGATIPMKSYCRLLFNFYILQRFQMDILHSMLRREYFVLITLPSINHCYDFGGFMLRTYLSARPFSAAA